MLPVTFRHSFRAFQFNTVLILIFVLLIVSVLDYYLFQAQTYFSTISSNTNVDLYLRSLCFHLRIYLPLIVFAIALWSLTAVNKTRITFKRILFLYISLWLCNEVVFEFLGWVRVHLFGLILIPVTDDEHYYLFESILGVPLIACFFLAYYAAITMPLILTEKISGLDTNNIAH